MIFKAGNFQIDYWEGGYPRWAHMEREGRDLNHGMDRSDLKDIYYLLGRVLEEDDRREREDERRKA